ncbi:histidine phosphatase family protein [Thalassospira sp.]|uniref:histidine phosphatase family protein n=1 Tax=Thalassospira sp. TaxID=1912094 RepID=UPI003AA979CE
MSGFAVTRWWLVRHAPVNNPDGVIYGRTDLPAIFEDDGLLKRVSAALPDDAIRVASNLARSIDTLKRLSLAQRDQLDIKVIPALAEQDFGVWEGQRWADIPADQARMFWDDYASSVPPGGESFNQLAVRVGEAFHALTTEYAGRNIVAVLHGGSMRAILASILGTPPVASLSFDVAPLAITRVDYLDAPDNPGWRIGSVNLML